MHPVDFFIAGVLIVAIVIVWWIATHHKAPVTASPKDITSTVTAGLADSWAQVKADLPGIVSAEVAQLREDKAVLQAALAAGEAKWAADKRAHEDVLAQVATRVAAAVQASPELPPSPGVLQAAASPDFPVTAGVT